MPLSLSLSHSVYLALTLTLSVLQHKNVAYAYALTASTYNIWYQSSRALNLLPTAISSNTTFLICFS